MGISLHGRSSLSGHAHHSRHHHRQRLALALVGAAVLLWLVFALLLAPAAAQAGQIVWSKGGDIWTMNDDGSGARVLVPVAAAPGMDELRSPGVHPDGTVVTFNGSTKANTFTRTGL